MSTTHRIRGIVIDVSATFVATITRRRRPGAKILCCSPDGSRPYSGSTSNPLPNRPPSISHASRMSRSAGMNTSTSPSSVSINASSTAATASSTYPPSSSASSGATCLISTGNIRPDTSITGAPPKACANASVSIVADVTSSFRSGRRRNKPARCPNRKSTFSERSCASSMITTEYARSNGSPWISASRIPSVMNLIRVSGPVSSLNLILHPTSLPHSTPSSSATRFDTLIAATRRGCVHPIIPRASGSASRHIFGNCVVFPDPVSPASTTTGFSRIAATISSRRRVIGSSSG